MAQTTQQTPASPEHFPLGAGRGKLPGYTPHGILQTAMPAQSHGHVYSDSVYTYTRMSSKPLSRFTLPHYTSYSGGNQAIGSAVFLTGILLFHSSPVGTLSKEPILLDDVRLRLAHFILLEAEEELRVLGLLLVGLAGLFVSVMTSVTVFRNASGAIRTGVRVITANTSMSAHSPSVR